VFYDSDVVYTDFDVYFHALVNIYALEAQLVFDFLEAYPTMNRVLENKIDINRVVALGHSTGGGGVVQLAVSNVSIKAVFGMDA